MNIFFTVLVIGLVLALIFLNIYFRVKIFKDYKYLVKHKVEFGTSHIFNSNKMEKEIIPYHKSHEDIIRSFSHKIKFSLRFALLIIVIISSIGLILKYIQV